MNEWMKNIIDNPITWQVKFYDVSTSILSSDSLLSTLCKRK
jgi:hypothetical protein